MFFALPRRMWMLVRASMKMMCINFCCVQVCRWPAVVGVTTEWLQGARTNLVSGISCIFLKTSKKKLSGGAHCIAVFFFVHWCSRSCFPEYLLGGSKNILHKVFVYIQDFQKKIHRPASVTWPISFKFLYVNYPPSCQHLSPGVKRKCTYQKSTFCTGRARAELQ